jgi:hypothetical protein
MELEANCHHAPLFLFLSQVLKIVVFSRCEWQRSEQESHARQELLIIDPQCHELTRMNLIAFPLPGASLSTVCHQIFGI